MKLKAVSAALMAATAGWSVQAGAIPVTTENTDLIINTHGGVEIKTTDKKFSFKVGGRIQDDQDIYEGAYNYQTSAPNRAGELADNNFLRRVRVELTGTAYYDWQYELTPNFSDTDNQINIEYAWLGFDSNRLLGFDSLTRVGRYKPYTGLEELTSSKWITGIERSTPTQFFVTGVKNQFGSQGSFMDHFTWGASYFRDTAGAESDGSDTHGYSARFTYSPIHKEGKAAHVGISYLDRETRSGNINIRQEVRNADQLVIPIEGGTQAINRSHIGFEALGIYGPFSLQGDYFMGWLDPAVDQGANKLDKLDVNGYNILARWDLTGESLAYDFKHAIPGQVKPTGRWGALELFARYSDFWMNENLGAGSALDINVMQVTAGLNWYINNNIKFALDYEHTDLGGDTLLSEVRRNVANPGDPVHYALFDSGNAIVTRAQFVF